MQAAAWFESGQLLLVMSANAKNETDRTRFRKEATKRLNRVAIQFDHKQLEPLPTRALLTLGQLAVQDKATEKARGRFEAVIKRHKTGPWRETGQAELKILEGKLGDGVFMLRKIRDQKVNAAAARWAADRLKSLGKD